MTNTESQRRPCPLRRFAVQNGIAHPRIHCRLLEADETTGATRESNAQGIVADQAGVVYLAERMHCKKAHHLNTQSEEVELS